MKKHFSIFFLSCLIFMTGCSQINNTTTPQIKNNQDILNFIEQTIKEKENCNQGIDNEKMFVSFAILGNGINNSGNIEYYVITNGEGIYIDKRGNINTSCGFGGIPTKIEIKKTENSFNLINYQTALDGNLYVSSTKKLFSPKAFRKRQKKDYKFNTNLSPLQRAEKYFGITFWTGGNFKCQFCDQNRYEYGYVDEKEIKDGNLETYVIYKNIPNENNYIKFKNNGSFINYGSWDEGTGTRIFGKNKETILVDAYPYHTYDRYIIQYQTGDKIHLIKEIIQK